MRSVVEFLVYFLMALTGAIGFATAMAVGLAALGGCALFGGSWCWRWWRGRR